MVQVAYQFFMYTICTTFYTIYILLSTVYIYTTFYTIYILLSTLYTLLYISPTAIYSVLKIHV